MDEDEVNKDCELLHEGWYLVPGLVDSCCNYFELKDTKLFLDKKSH
jgi:hypothetical protein